MGLLKNAASGVLIARRIRNGGALRDALMPVHKYASSSSRLAALLVSLFKQPLAVIQACVTAVSEIATR